MAAGTPAAPAGTGGQDERDAVITALARVFARLAVHLAPGQGAASFRQVVTAELRVATPAEADLIERWLTDHPAGG